MLTFACLVLVTINSAASFVPHIIIITADGIGFNDLGFSNGGAGDSTVSQNLDRYAKSDFGTIFDKYYVMPNGHATRSALLTGKHPAHLGTQFELKDATSQYGLDPNEFMLADHLKKLGYETHAVGQWDLGFYSDRHIPTSRGYKTFYGSYLTYGHYTNHWASDQAGNYGHDLHDNDVSDKSEFFKTELYRQRAEKIIHDHVAAHGNSKPLHLYLALQAAQIQNINQFCANGHGENIPNSYRVKGDMDPLRRCYLAMVKAVDIAYGAIMKALLDNMMLTNSIVIFTTTSGGPAAGGSDFNMASNSPLRGAKMTGWEGGVRGAGFMYTTRGYKQRTQCLFHVTDWIPTLMTFHQQVDHTNREKVQEMVKEMDIYGVDQYKCIFNSGASKRNSIVHFLYGNSASIMSNNYKLIMDKDNHFNGMHEWYNTMESSSDAGIRCNVRTTSCDIETNACLFNIAHDPCEHQNLASQKPMDLHKLEQDLKEFNRTVNYNVARIPDPDGKPENHGYEWKPWIDSNSAMSNQNLSIISLIIAIISSLTLVS